LESPFPHLCAASFIEARAARLFSSARGLEDAGGVYGPTFRNIGRGAPEAPAFRRGREADTARKAAAEVEFCGLFWY
jgi:hypothetical protein